MKKTEEKANNMHLQDVSQGPDHAASQAEERCYAFTPWRRLFAFFLDINLCMLIWRAVLSLALHVNLSRYDEWGLWLLFTYAAALLQFLLDPGCCIVLAPRQARRLLASTLKRNRANALPMLRCLHAHGSGF